MLEQSEIAETERHENDEFTRVIFTTPAVVMRADINITIYLFHGCRMVSRLQIQ